MSLSFKAQSLSAAFRACRILGSPTGLPVLQCILRRMEFVSEHHILEAFQSGVKPIVIDALLSTKSNGKPVLQVVGEDGRENPAGLLRCWAQSNNWWRNEDAVVLDYLIAKGEDPSAICGPEGAVLNYAIACNIMQYPRKVKLLLARGVDPNIKGPYGSALKLIWQSSREDGREFDIDLAACAWILLDAGAVVNWKDYYGPTPSKHDIIAWIRKVENPENDHVVRRDSERDFKYVSDRW